MVPFRVAGIRGYGYGGAGYGAPEGVAVAAGAGTVGDACGVAVGASDRLSIAIWLTYDTVFGQTGSRRLATVCQSSEPSSRQALSKAVDRHPGPAL